MDRRLLSTCFVLAAIVMSLKAVQAARGHYFRKLVDDLFLTYHKDIRPVSNTSEAITVKFSVFLFQILELDEKNQILTAYLWLRQEWVDVELSWNPEKYDGLQTIRLPSKKIWLPDIVLYNNADETFTKNLQTNVILKSNGHIRWDQPAITKTSCEMDVSYFPFDSQSCPFTFGSWTFYLEHLDIIAAQSQGNRDDFVTNVEWEVLDMPVVRKVEQYSCCPDPYPIVQIQLNLKRKSTFYIFNLVLPCVFISLLLPLTFYLPAESGEKVSLGVTTLLAMTVFQLLVAENMPPSEKVPLIGKYYITTMALMSFSTSMTIFVQNIHFCGPNPPEVPKWLRKLVLGRLAKFLNIKIQTKRQDDDLNVEESKPFEYKSKFLPKETKKKEASRKVSTTENYQADEDRPFLTDVKASAGKHKIRTNFDEKRCERKIKRPNGIGWFGRNIGLHFNGTSSLRQIEEHTQEFGRGQNASTRKNHLSKLKSENRCSWPSLVEHRVSQPRPDCSCLPRTNGNSRLCYRHRVEKSYPCKMGTSMDARSITIVPQYSRSTISTFSKEANTSVTRQRRNTLVEMNLMAKSLDFSDDTEVSMVTPTFSDPHKIESPLPRPPSTYLSQKEVDNNMFYIESPTWSATKLGTLSKSHPRLNENLKESSVGCFDTVETEFGRSGSRHSSLGRNTRDVITRPYKRKTTEILNDQCADNKAISDPRTATNEAPEPICGNPRRDSQFQSILSDVNVIADHYRHQRMVVETSDEWKSVSRVCDRALMWMFVIIQVLFSTLILCKII